MVSLDGIPARMARLPLDARGYPVPKFVEWIDGKPDFRVMKAGHFAACIQRKLCWICGEPLGRWMCFVIGPTGSVHHVSSEPPSHRECGTFAVKTCPFLVFPNRQRDDHDLPVDATTAATTADNPGATALWVTDNYRTFNPPSGSETLFGGGVLFNIGPAREVEWWARGRRATREEVLASFDKGIAQLREDAKKHGAEAERSIEKRVTEAIRLVPA
jgi:hypothetical protein